MKTLAVFLLALFFYFSPSLSAPFSSRGQAREALVVAAMFQQDNLILPLRNGTDVPSKPPLFHWSAYGASLIAGGLSEATTRTPSLLAAAATVALTYYCVAGLFGIRTGILAAIILGSTLEWIRGANVARVDMVFAFCLSCGFFLLLEIARRAAKVQPPAGWLYFLLGLALGGGILTKGPTGLLIPLVAAAFYLLSQYRLNFRQAFTDFPLKLVVMACLVSLLVSAWWYLAAYLQGGNRFLEVALLRENFARVVDVEGLDPGHQKPFYFSLIDFAVGFLPWSVLAIPLLYVVFRSRDFGGMPEVRSAILLSLCWAVSFVVAVALASSKRTVYLIPAYPALALVLSYYLANATRIPQLKFTFCRLVLGFVWAMLVVIVALLACLLLGGAELFSKLPFIDPRYLDDVIYISSVLKSSIPFFVGLVLALIFLVIALLSARKAALDISCGALGLGIGFVALALNYGAFPQIAEFNSPKEFSQKLKEIVPTRAPIYYYRNDFFSVVYYSGRNIPELKDLAALGIDPETYLLIAKRDLPLTDGLGERRRVVLESDNNAFYGKDKLILLRISQ